MDSKSSNNFKTRNMKNTTRHIVKNKTKKPPTCQKLHQLFSTRDHSSYLHLLGLIWQILKTFWLSHLGEGRGCATGI